jgi:signal transduction histidine kinase
VRSIEQRLRAGLVASLVGLFGVLGLAAHLLLQDLTEGFVATRLGHDAEALLAGLQFDAAGQPLLPEARIATIYLQPFSGHYYTVLAGGVELRSRSLWDETLTLPELATGRTATLHTTGPAGQPLLLVAAAYRKQDHAVTVSVAENLSPLQARLRWFVLALGGLMLAGLLLLVLVQARLLRRAFRPLDAARAELRALEEGRVERLAETVPAEVLPLVQEVNRLVAALVGRLTRSRNALGNLAHALKGPLSLLRQASEEGRLTERQALAAEVREQTIRLQQLVDAELARARVAGGGSPATRFVPGEELPALAALVERLHGARGIRIEWRSELERLRVDRDDMLALLGNLLDNAGKWAHGSVRVALVRAGAGFALTVEDDGPGCPDEALGRLTARGVRIDESVPGHGLGLSIVRDIAEAYGASLHLDRSPTLGGLRVTLTFPAT